MRKSVFLTLLIALFSVATAWAEFNPDPSKTYSLKVKDSSLYLDIQTMEIHEPGKTTHSLSLNKVPCAIRFVEGANGTTWKMMNVYGSYAGWNSWNTHIVHSNYAKEWIIAESEVDLVTIARDATNYIGWDKSTTPIAGSALYSNAEDGNKNAERLQFVVEEYVAPAFSPIVGKAYYLMDRTSGLFLDIETKGVNEPNQGTTNNISLSDKPCVVYFESGNGGKWKLKNSKGEYIGRGNHTWNAVIGATHEWTIAEINGAIAISSESGQFIGADNKVASKPLYCDRDLGMQFTLVEPNTLETYYALKSPQGTYLNFTQVDDTKASFQSVPSYLYMIPSADDYIFRSVEGEIKFVGSTHAWNATTDFALWNVSEGEEVTITRAFESDKHLGNEDALKGMGIFTNVPNTCNSWQIVKAYPLNVVYEFNGEQQTESKIVWADENYTITLPDEYSGKVIASCTATNGVTPQKTNDTWSVEVTAATTVTVTLSAGDEEQEQNGYYRITWKKSEAESLTMFMGHNTVTDAGNAIGYKMLAEGQYSTDAAADMVFALIPQGDGFVISAQGMYLQAPQFNEWKHVMFSDNVDEAGVYLFEEVEGLAGVFNVRGEGENETDKNDPNYWAHNNYFQVYDINDQGNYIIGNNPLSLAHSFILTPATTYEVAQGMTPLCLPFNVKLPTGVVAYDIVNATEGTLESQENLFVELAAAGDILLAGTPVFLDAKAATSLTITMKSEGAKTSLDGSLLEGNFVKQTVEMGDTKKFVLKKGKFEAITVATEMSANSCWVVTRITDENANVEPGHIIIDGWEFTYTDEMKNGRITLVDCVKEGESDLTIGSKYIVNGEEKEVVAISPTFLHGNTTLTSVTIPASMTNLGFRVIEPMFEESYEGQPGDSATYKEGTTEIINSVGMHRCLVFPNDPDTGNPYVVGKDFAWKLTLDITIDVPEGGEHPSYNPWGSAVVSTKPNSLDDNYQGYMQIYLWKDLQHIVVKIDNADDRYATSTPALDANGNETGELYVNKKFTFEMEHDGAGGYQVVVYFGNGKAKMFNITATKDNMVGDFDRLYYSLPEGIHVDVKFEKLLTQGLFVGCTNLEEIKVDPANPTFKSCEHGVLYDKNGFYVMRIPEAGGHVEEDGRRHFNIPSKVVKFYQGAVHGVDADIVLHSNPQIVVVEGHSVPAKFYLSLDDKDTTIVEGETGYGGARNFTSANANHYQSARYKRAPLKSKDIYGTFMLPFAPTNWKDKYEFFELKAASGDCLTFTQVDELEPKTPYIYRLKPGIEPGDDKVMTMENGLDVFETTDTFTVELLAKFAHDGETELVPLGAYVNGTIKTSDYPGSNYYIYQSSTNKFHRVTKKLTYRPYRALFVWNPKQAQAPARFGLRILKRDGTTTEIDPSQIEGWEEDVYYDLQGRRVENPTQGIYIVNGKKVIVK